MRFFPGPRRILRRTIAASRRFCAINTVWALRRLCATAKFITYGWKSSTNEERRSMGRRSGRLTVSIRDVISGACAVTSAAGADLKENALPLD